MASNKHAQEKEAVTEERILEMAEVFAKVLKDSPAFQRYTRAQQDMERDPLAKKAIRDLQKMQSKLQRSRFLGRAIPSEAAEVRRLQQVMLATPSVQKLLEAQEDLVLLFQEAAGIISEVIEMDFAAACAQAGGCC